MDVEIIIEEELNEKQSFSTPTLPQLNNVIFNPIESVGSVAISPFVPHTPMSLAPLITKCNQTWTSDMETPVAEKSKQLDATPVDPLIEKIKDQILSPVADKSISPIVFNKKRRRPKRRIFKSSLEIDGDVNDLRSEQLDQTIQSTSSGTTLNSSETAKTSSTIIDNALSIEDENIDDTCNINKKGMKSQDDDPINTSSQDFFNNANFSMIDRICFDHVKTTEVEEKQTETKSEANVVELLKSCREKLKKRYQSTNMESERILSSQVVNESAEQELISIKPMNSKTSLPKIPSGVTATELFNIVVDSNSEGSDKFKKPSDKNQEKEHKSGSNSLNVTCSETQLLACCDLAELMDDVNDWSGNKNSKSIKSYDEIRINSIESNKNLVKDIFVSSGFKTAGGQNISINKNKLLKARELYEETSEINSLNIGKTENINLHAKSSFETKDQNGYCKMVTTGFKTASSSSISIDKNKLSKAKMMADQIFMDSVTEQNSEIPNLEKNLLDKKQQEISLASKNQNYSFNNINESPNETEKSNLKTSVPTPTTLRNIVQSGFKTASGGNIFINKTNIVKANKILEECSEFEQTCFQEVNNDNNYINNSLTFEKTMDSKPIETFSINSRTSNEDSVCVKKSSFPRTQSYNNEIDTLMKLSEKAVAKTFSTANGNVVSVDKTKLSHAQKMFEKICSVEKKELNKFDSVEDEVVPSRDSNSPLDSTRSVLLQDSNLSLISLGRQSKSQHVITSTRQSLKRKWLSDSDIRCHPNENKSNELNTSKNQSQKRMKSSDPSGTNLKKSASLDNCFDFATDDIMSNLNIADLFEISTEKHYSPDIDINQCVSYPEKTEQPFLQELTKRFSLPESNLRKLAMKNSTNRAVNRIRSNENFAGFSLEEIQQSELICEKMSSLLSNYTGISSNDAYVNVDSTVPSSQLIIHSEDKDDIYFSEPSMGDWTLHDKSQSSELELSFQKSDYGEREDLNCTKSINSRNENEIINEKVISRDEKLPTKKAYKYYIKNRAILGEDIKRKEEIIENIDEPTSPPFHGFMPPDDHPVSLLSNLIMNMKQKKLLNTETDSSSEAKDSPDFDFTPIKNRCKPKRLSLSLTRSKKKVETPFVNKLKTAHRTPFVTSSESINTLSSSGGFKTASGQPITISNESLARAKKMLLVEEDNFNQNLVESEKSSGELKKTVINSTNVSNENSEQARKLLTLEKTNLRDDRDVSKKTFSSDSTPSLGSFKTAAGKSIQLSRKSLEKARRFIALEDEDSNNYVSNVNSKPVSNIAPFFGGFKTASGNSIAISEASLERGKRLLTLENEYLDLMNIELGKSTDGLSKITASTGFKTASGKAIKISEESMEGARKIFQSCYDSPDLSGPRNDALSKSDYTKTPLSSNSIPKLKTHTAPNFSRQRVGFVTASNRPINISADKLETAKKLFADIVDESLDFSNNTENTSLKRKFENENRTSNGNKLEKIKKMKLADEQEAGKHKNILDDMTEINISENTPTSPIIGNRRKRYKKKVRMSMIEVNDKKDESINREEENISLARRYSLPASLDKKESRVDFICEFEVSNNVEEDRLAASLLQDKMINIKKRHKPKPIEGVLFLYRKEEKNNRISWKTVSNNTAPKLKNIKEIIENNLDPKILNITAYNGTSYMFHIIDIIREDINPEAVVGLNLSNNVRLLLNKNGYITFSEFRKAFLASPGVDPSMIPDDWIENHFNLIVWKLASIDRNKFGNAVIPRFLTPSRIMEELKYRYDREIDRSQRSALRKILEKDETPSKRIVLCVSKIGQVSESDNQSKDKTPAQSSLMKKIEVTDGWYTVPITFDIPFLHHITSGKIKEGTKIITCGAELLGCERGCHPLERLSDLSLKIHTNATRRVKWDTKLGFQQNSEPFPIKLQSVDPNGGLIGRITVVISRIFPILYREKMADGQSIFRNARCEEKAAAAYEVECQNRAEAIYAKAEKDFHQIADSQGESQSNWDNYKMVSGTQSRQVLQQAKQEELKQRLERELRANLPPRRQVTPVLKIRVADEDTSALVTIWSGSDDVSDSLKEGSCISIYNATASGRRSGELHLSFSNFSMFKSEPSLGISYPVRTYTPISDLCQPNFSPAYSEFDTVGIIVSITDPPRGMKNFEVVNIAYPLDDVNSKYLSIYFWQGMSTSGYSSILVKGSIIACSNLEWRCNSSRSIPAGYYNEKTSFSCNPRQAHLREPFQNLRNRVKNRLDYIKKCAEEIAQEFEKMSAAKITSNPGTPTVNNKSLHINSPQTPIGLNRSDLNTPVRSSDIQKRLEMLSRYGEAPSLSPLMTQSSSRVKSGFISLRKSNPE